MKRNVESKEAFRKEKDIDLWKDIKSCSNTII